MKKTWVLLVIMFLLCSASAFAFDFGFGYNARTGDKDLDMNLGKLNVEGKADINNFISDLSVNFNRPKSDIENLLYVVKMHPADAYLTLRISHLANKPLEEVIGEYKANKGKGWGVIAKNLGIKPGSSAFHALKNDTAVDLGRIKAKKEKEKEIKKEKENKERETGVKKETGKGHNK